ncbi:hypothetical protein C8R44DRAFT_905073 [Mycena epipterygia]|nr:hypothetical protein C8R44DRAFT_905073 [Mycena epipterygia]
MPFIVDRPSKFWPPAKKRGKNMESTRIFKVDLGDVSNNTPRSYAHTELPIDHTPSCPLLSWPPIVGDPLNVPRETSLRVLLAVPVQRTLWVTIQTHKFLTLWSWTALSILRLTQIMMTVMLKIWPPGISHGKNFRGGFLSSLSKSGSGEHNFEPEIILDRATDHLQALFVRNCTATKIIGTTGHLANKSENKVWWLLGWFSIKGWLGIQCTEHCQCCFAAQYDIPGSADFWTTQSFSAWGSIFPAGWLRPFFAFDSLLARSLLFAPRFRPLRSSFLQCVRLGGKEQYAMAAIFMMQLSNFRVELQRQTLEPDLTHLECIPRRACDDV